MVVNRLLTGMIVLLGVCFLHMLVQHLSTGLFSNIIIVKSSKLIKTQNLHIEIDIASVYTDMHTHFAWSMSLISQVLRQQKTQTSLHIPTNEKGVYLNSIYQPKRPKDQQPPWKNPPSPKQPQPEATVGGETQNSTLWAPRPCNLLFVRAASISDNLWWCFFSPW